MARAAEDAPVLTVRSRVELHDWLAAHHASAGSVWLARYKKPHPDHLPYAAVVEELLCWGWIDSVTRALDEDRSMILIAPRNVKSAWSAVNKAHVARAMASGAMTAAGLEKVQAAKANGMWEFLDDVERLEVPPDLALALGEAQGEAIGQAEAVFAAYPRSIKRGVLEWVKTARTAETRAARIAELARDAAAGLRPRLFRR